VYTLLTDTKLSTGDYPSISLSQARERRQQFHAWITEGYDSWRQFLKFLVNLLPFFISFTRGFFYITFENPWRNQKEGFFNFRVITGTSGCTKKMPQHFLPFGKPGHFQ